MKQLILNPMPLLSCACLLLSSTVSYAQTCQTTNIEASTPSSRFEILGNGSEVKDKQTGLIWQRCSLGQTWNGTTCTGSAKQYNWQQALIQAKAVGNGYRLPNIKELHSIVELQCYDPAINTTVFPNTPSDDSYWSSSPVVYLASRNSAAWYVHFRDGYISASYESGSNYVRAVRSESR